MRPPPALAGLAVALAILLPGCLTAEPAPQAAPAGLAGALRPLREAAMPQESQGAEPTLARLADGTLFITAKTGSQEAPNLREGRSWLWRSTDDGATWERLRGPTRDTATGDDDLFYSTDPDVVASDDGWVYYLDWWIAGASNFLVERSPDGGATWQVASVTTPHATAVDRPWLLAGPGGHVAIYYTAIPPQDLAPLLLPDAVPVPRQLRLSIEVVESGDHGATWGPPRTVVPADLVLIARPFLLPGGAVVLPYGLVQGGDLFTSPAEVRVQVSPDLGATWGPPVVVAEAPEGFEAVWPLQGAADAAGRVHLAWNARTGPTMTLFAARSADGGATWTAPEVVRAEGTNALPWVAAQGRGHVAIGWYGGDATGDPREAPDDAPWHAYVAERRGDGAPWVLGKASAEPVKSGPFCPRGSICHQEGENRELMDYVGLLWGDGGTLHYGFTRSRDADGAKVGFVHHVALAPGEAATRS